MIDYARLNEIEARLKAFKEATHSQDDDPEPGWKASDTFHFNSASDIEWMTVMLNQQLAENERLMAAGRKLTENSRGHYYDYCVVCSAYSNEEHEPDCPTWAFAEVKHGQG